MKKCLVIGLLCTLCWGCSIFKIDDPQMNKGAEQLASEGAASFMSEDYRDAVKAYTNLKDWYPFSKYAILAELKIADAHFNLEEYDEAVVAYENFEKMHPRNEAVPYVIDQIGMCWFKRIDTVDRDVTPARNAMAQFRRLIRQFPASEYRNEAEKRIETCINTIAAHELYVADYYNKTKAFTSALKRYEYIVEFYPGTRQSEIAMAKIPEVSKKVKKEE